MAALTLGNGNRASDARPDALNPAATVPRANDQFQ
jgi:hypothetical protein